MKELKLEKITITYLDQIMEILENDLSLNYQIGLHNSEIPIPVYNYKKIKSIFTNGYHNNSYRSIYDFSTAFGNISDVKKRSEWFYNYNYWDAIHYHNFIFAFPEYINLDSNNYFLGKYHDDELTCVLTDYLFDHKDIPKEFIYGVLVRRKGFKLKLIRNPHHLYLRTEEEKEEFYNQWLTESDKNVLESINAGKCSSIPTDYRNLVLHTIEQKNKVLKKNIILKKMGTDNFNFQ